MRAWPRTRAAVAADTHSFSRRDPRNQDMSFSFFATGIVTDVCGGVGCGPLTA